MFERTKLISRAVAWLVPLMGLLLAGNALADDVKSLFDVGENEGSDENREYLIDRNLESSVKGQIDVGDSIRGYFNINTVNSAGGNVGGNTGNNEWSGVYQLKIVEKEDFGGGIYRFIAAPDPAFAADLSGGIGISNGFVPGSGAVVVFFEDPTPNAAFDFDDDSPSEQIASPDDGTTGPNTTPPSSEDVSVGPYAKEEEFVATATDGAHFWTLGFNGGPGEGLKIFTQNGDNILYGFSFASGVSYASLDAGLSRLSNGNPGVGDDVKVTPITAGAFGPVEFALNGNLKGVANLDTPFELSSDLTVTFDVRPSLGDRLWEDLNGNGVQDCDDTNMNLIIGDPGDIGPECDAGIENATVHLLDPGDDELCGTGDEEVLETELTDDRGFYGFPDLDATPTQYCIEFVKPESGFCARGNEVVFTKVHQGTDRSKDSDADPVTGQTPNIELPSRDTFDVTWDAGVYCPSSLGDRFWDDSDTPDGIQGDPGVEPGIPDVTVNLYACDKLDGTAGLSPVMNDMTGAAGLYDFELPPGVYDVEFKLPPGLVNSGYIFTLQNQGGDPSIDSDADPTTGRTGCVIELASDGEDPTWDGGAWAPDAGLGDRLWHDLNHNGLQETGESGVDGVEVTLFENPDGDASCNSGDEGEIDNQLTVGGNYQFQNLFAGDYCVQFAKPVPFCDFGEVQFTLQNSGGDDSIDSDVDPTTGRTGNISLAHNATDLTWDAGVYCPASLGDRFWDDSDNPDGIQGDPSVEPGIADAAVNLYRCDGLGGTPGGSSESTITDADGLYSFIVEPGVYDVEIVIPPEMVSLGYIYTLQNQGGDPALDSDIDPTTGRTGCLIEMGSNEDDPTWDGGAYSPNAGLGDRLWEDLNVNGIQDGGEPGIGGSTVRLLENPDGDAACNSGDEREIDSQSTVAGAYLFEELFTGDYCVQFDSPRDYCPFGQTSFTLQNVGVDDSVDSDVDPATGRTGNIFLPSGTTDLTWDAGVYCLARLGDRVWDDINGDGIQNCLDSNMDGIIGNEGDIGPECANAGIPEVEVKLLGPGDDGLCNTADEVPLDRTTTDPIGFYLFDRLEPGSYCVEVDRPAAFSDCTTANIGVDNATDSDVQEPGITPPISCQTEDPAENPIDLQSGEDDRTWDAGLLSPSERCDVDNNKVIDRNDIRSILRSRRQPATGPDDPRDADGDGTISTRDAKLCIRQCTNANCAP